MARKVYRGKVREIAMQLQDKTLERQEQTITELLQHVKRSQSRSGRGQARFG